MNDASRLPEFFAVGPQRTGTSWLHQVMESHVGVPAGIKETDFFLRNYSKGMKWYLSFFRSHPPGMTRGEVDPNYFGEDLARERIAKDIPGAKIIVTLRDPADRAYSSYRVMRRDAWTRVGIEETVTTNRIIRESSRYAHHLANWERSFGKDRVLVCFYDDLERSPQMFIDRITDFIGAQRIKVEGSPLASERVNTVTQAPRSPRLAAKARNLRGSLKMRGMHWAVDLLGAAGVWKFCFGRGEEFAALDPAIDARLREHFRPEVEALERLIGRDLSVWKSPRDGTHLPPIKSSATA
jgi:hypothetical protein